MSQRLAAIDVGTNTVLLAVADARGGVLEPILERATITRLGKGVDRTRRLAEDARARTLVVLRQYGSLLSEHGVTAVAAVCTSAVRDAENGADFLAKARDALGYELAVIGGAEEAALTFAGALSGLSLTGAVTVFDVGGGSTEVICGTAGAAPQLQAAVSLDVGSVRLTERYLTSDPPAPEALAALRADVSTQLSAAPRPAGGAALVGVAGTVTTLAAIDAQMLVYDAARVHGATLPRDRIEALASRLTRMTLAERLALPGLEQGRADVIAAGAEIVCTLLTWARADALIVSDRGVRWGLLRRLLQHRAPPG